MGAENFVAKAAPVASPAATRRPGCRVLEGAHESRDRQEEEEREGEVGRDERAVGEDVGRERGETERRGRGTGAEAAARLEEDGDEKARGERHHRQPAEEEQPVGVVPAVQEAPAELPLPRLGPREVVRCATGPHGEERRRGEQLHERRLLGVQPVVAESEVGVARRQVGALVERRRVAPHRVDGEPGLEGHGQGQERDRTPSAHGRGTGCSHHLVHRPRDRLRGDAVRDLVGVLVVGAVHDQAVPAQAAVEGRRSTTSPPPPPPPARPWRGSPRTGSASSSGLPNSGKIATTNGTPRSRHSPAHGAAGRVRAAIHPA